MEFITFEELPLRYGIFGFAIFIIAEVLYSKALSHHKEDREIYEWKDMFSSISTGIIGAVIGAVVKLTILIVVLKSTYEFFNYRTEEGVMMNIFGWKSFGSEWYVFLICQLLDDFSYYWFHRLNHTVRFMWAAHIVHHSSDHYNFGTGVRNGWFTLMYKPFFYMWLPAIGFHYEMVIFCLGIEALWQFQLHTKYVPKLGFLEKILNTHTMHQAHHAQNMQYLDKNHGGYLNIFDKIFGTHADLDDDIEVKYGVIHAPNSYNPFVIATHEYADIWRDVKKSKNLKEAFMYVFGPPGWSPDGSTLTVRQIHRKLKEGVPIEDLEKKA